MDFGGNMFCLGIGDQSGNNNSNSDCWDSWEITTSTSSKVMNAFHHITATENSSAVNSSHEAAGLANSLMFLPQPHNGGVNHHHRHNQPHQYGGDGSQKVHVDPHLMCLKLGKRNYFDTSGAALKGGGGGGVKTVSLAATVPRCQVEGCHVALLKAKDYHRRHKVCEMHSKAPKVVVLGLVQRFCQQCSRFHVVSEFDDSKRSCRRRLAGHNERRRKNSHNSVTRNTASEGNMLIVEDFPYLLSAGCALSLLPSRTNSWVSPVDLSIRCRAALNELIEENRAALMARSPVPEKDWHLHHQTVEDFKMIQPDSNYFPQQMFHQTQ
ncbi:unnamed protein product [Lupinus luteus]|uniref:SBP-type domain-containing protein n=1 Tax=Lupinus luteus TaxID=3873 RepID=A0AAV1W1P1_LUPLU